MGVLILVSGKKEDRDGHFELCVVKKKQKKNQHSKSLIAFRKPCFFVVITVPVDVLVPDSRTSAGIVMIQCGSHICIRQTLEGFNIQNVS